MGDNLVEIERRDRASLESLSAGSRTQVEGTFAALQERGVQSSFVPDRQAALAKLLELIPPGAQVAHGHSTTLEEIGLVDYLEGPDSGYRYLNAEWEAEEDAAERRRLRARLSIASDYYLGSVQAVCETGQVVAADATGSRQAFYIYGPPHVIWVAGINKLVSTLDDGLRRLREVALPLEDQRTKSAGRRGSYIGKRVVYERERPGRITLVLVGESLGF
jgi:L-lactate utilization protein LutB